MQLNKKMTRGLLPTLLCTLVLLLAACGSSGSGGATSTASKAPDNKQIFIRPLPGFSDIKTFDPALASDLYSAQVIELAFTGLVGLNDQQEVIDELAASHSVAADGTTYTFKLKPNLKFSD